MSVVYRAKGLPPLIMTFNELRSVLGQIAADNKWSQGTIHDLWKMGAPTPMSVVGTSTEKRIILPKQLFKWLETTLNENGQPLDESALAYIDLMEKSSRYG